jgi:putative Mg2+ transporter-C (MgtC) family protein
VLAGWQIRARAASDDDGIVSVSVEDDGGRVPGVRYIPAAAIATALVLGAHLAVRPVARRVDRLPAGTKVETLYQFRAVTGAAEEAHIRTLLVRELTGGDFILHSVQSHDLDGPARLAEVTAEAQSHGRDDLALEAAVSRLSLEPAVSSVTWTTSDPDPALISAGE